MIKDKLAKLDTLLRKCDILLTLLHDYPDPDALASAFVLSHLVSKRYGSQTHIAYGGVVTRAENRAMVQQLKMKLIHVDEIAWEHYPHIAMVDTQPAFNNHSLPRDIKPTIVIDHHGKRKGFEVAFFDIRTEYGACATMLLEYLEAAGLSVTVDIATAVAYAIRSETQELGREASASDISTYLAVYPKANIRKLARIVKPLLPKSYFVLLERSLRKAKVFRHLTHVHLGKVKSPEFVSQFADLLLRHERIGWSLATGRFKGKLFVSMRCSDPHAKAGNILKQIVGTLGSAGGHAMMAGGQIFFDEYKYKNWQQLEDMVIVRFLRKLGMSETTEWKSMLLRNGM
ncbi:MAG: DHH family phosphoesterase [Gemmatimonadota bacterium]|nr:MAG: DHH family phosphoesterase [Gemmatimonadota bacterium]